MDIQTTINMNKLILLELTQAANRLHLSRTIVIRLLIKQFLDDNNNIHIFNSPVRYQARDKDTNWTTFHLTLHQDEYECCLDLRKVYKMSLSSIIAFSVKNYLVKIYTMFSQNTYGKIWDKYLFHNYLFSLNTINGIKCIRIYWGITNFKILTDNNQKLFDIPTEENLLYQV